MKLYYFVGGGGSGNFGDDLNPWLWEQLFPDLFDEDERVTFVGIGTLLNDWTPCKGHTIVFGAGVGYVKDELPKIDENWTIYCVRGPLSAKELDLPEDRAVTDPAALLARFSDTLDLQKHFPVSYMPHHANANRETAACCRHTGFHYIDPTERIEEVLASLAATELLVTEALHGAICADALRIPWIPVRTSSSVFEFKWHDWCASLDLQYAPHPMPRLFLRGGPLLAPVRNARVRRVARLLRSLAHPSRAILSSKATLDARLLILEERIEEFRNDLAAGRFDIGRA